MGGGQTGVMMTARTIAFLAILGSLVAGNLAHGEQYLTNGSFQIGDLTGWTATGMIDAWVTDSHTGYDEQGQPHTIYPADDRYYFGMVNAVNGGYGAVYQTVEVPAGKEVSVDFSWRTVLGSGVGGYVAINNSATAPSPSGNLFKGLESSCVYSADSNSFMTDWADVSQSFQSDGYITLSFFSETVSGDVSVVCLDGASVIVPPEPIEETTGPRITLCEIVTDNAAPMAWGAPCGDAWGGNQPRIVRTEDGVFTTYITPGADWEKQWNLARRNEQGGWDVIAQGGENNLRNPVHLTAEPDGTLHILGWPDGTGKMYSGSPNDFEQGQFSTTSVPGMPTGHYWPYTACGTDLETGDLVMVLSDGEQPGYLRTAYYHADTAQWSTRVTEIPERHCYGYVFPDDGALSIVETRDVGWEVMGYTKPPGHQMNQVFNAWRYWQTDDFDTSDLTELAYEVLEPNYPGQLVNKSAQQDAYIDTAGRLHVLYWETTDPNESPWARPRHAVLEPDGTIIADVELPYDNNTSRYRIFEDASGRFWLIDCDGKLYPAGTDGLTLGNPIQLDLGGFTVQYQGYAIALPRTGTPLSNTVDITFHSGSDMSELVYVQLKLPDPGDIDDDGDVDNVDFGALYGSFSGPGATDKVWGDGDMDFDGDVDNVDFGLLYGNYTGPLAGEMDLQVTPEPCALGLLAVGGLALLGRKRR